MRPKQVASALTYAGVLFVPHGWLFLVALVAPVLVVCVTVVVLVFSAERSQRVAAIKALAPALVAFASRLTIGQSASRRS
jgi:hypothetical protein